MAAIFWQFSRHKMAKKQNLQNRYIQPAELHTEKPQTKPQVPSMQAVQMNAPHVHPSGFRFEVPARTAITGKSRSSKIHNSGQEQNFPMRSPTSPTAQ